MTGELIEDVVRFLRALEGTQEELAQVFARKQGLLTGIDPSALEEAARAEGEVNGRLRKLVGVRRELLERAGRQGLPSESLKDVVARLGGAAAEQLSPLIERVGRNSARLRTESWGQWILAQRAGQHDGQLIDLIANAGRRAATYSAGAERAAGGGAILDATA